jgi:putative DNA primase/helicase
MAHTEGKNENLNYYMVVESAEKIILGSVLLGKRAFKEAQTSGLKVSDFSTSLHRNIFARITALVESGRAVEMSTLVPELLGHKEISEQDIPYFGSLMVGLPERATLEPQIKIVREAAARRQIAEQLEICQMAAGDSRIPLSAVSERVAQISEGPEGNVLPPEFSEDAVALRFTRKFEDEVRFVNSWGKWLRWTGQYWKTDSTLRIFDAVRTICREMASECPDQKLIANRLSSGRTVAAAETLARADRRHAASPEEFDSSPWVLNTPTGLVDLRTGQVREHRRSDLITKITTAGPGQGCDRWLQFLDEITGKDEELQQFFQRMIGYCLTGITREHALFFLYGTGANGKSVFLSTISTLLGDYARTASTSSFTASSTEQHPTDLAALRGARFVMAIETEDGARWAESKIKSLTGGDKIAARFMRQDFFEFKPEFKLVVSGNHKPGLRSVDEAMRRRLHLVPFTITIPEHERDAHLTDKLRGELPGIMSWAIQGCLDWQAQGLNPPAIVRDATAKYLAAEDAFGRWLEERCVVESSAWASSSSLFADWKDWAERNGEYAGSQKRFSEQLEARGFQPERTREARGFIGIASVTDVTDVTHSRI